MGSTLKITDDSTKSTTWPLAGGNTYFNTINCIVPSLSATNSATYTRAVTTGIVTVINGGGSPIAHNIPATENGKDIILTRNTGGLTAGAKKYSNFQWISTTSFSCVDSVKTSTTGTLKSSNTVILVDSITIPGGSLGSRGYLEGWVVTNNNNSAGVKNVYADLGNSLNVIGSATLTTNTTSILTSFNRLTLESTSSQFISNGSTKLTIDTTLSQTLSIRAQCVSANDYIVINSYVINSSQIG